jgi:hypothetical protein
MRDARTHLDGVIVRLLPLLILHKTQKASTFAKDAKLTNAMNILSAGKYIHHAVSMLLFYIA